MPRSATTKKAKPVPISTPLENVSLYVTLDRARKEAEKVMKSLREAVLAVIPAGQDKELIPATRNGEPGNYVIARTLSDRRAIDDEKLTKALQERGLYVAACKTVPDHERVAKMIEEGRFPQEALAQCMTDPPENANEDGLTVSLSVKFEPVK